MSSLDRRETEDEARLAMRHHEACAREARSELARLHGPFGVVSRLLRTWHDEVAAAQRALDAHQRGKADAEALLATVTASARPQRIDGPTPSPDTHARGTPPPGTDDAARIARIVEGLDRLGAAGEREAPLRSAGAHLLRAIAARGAPRSSHHPLIRALLWVRDGPDPVAPALRAFLAAAHDLGIPLHLRDDGGLAEHVRATLSPYTEREVERRVEQKQLEQERQRILARWGSVVDQTDEAG